MGKQAVGQRRAGWVVGAVAALSCAAACDSGSSTLFEGNAGAGSSQSGSGQGGSAAGGSAGQPGGGSGATSGAGGHSGGGAGVGTAGTSSGGTAGTADGGASGEGGATSGEGGATGGEGGAAGGEGGAGGEQGGTGGGGGAGGSAGTGGSLNLGGLGGSGGGCNAAGSSFAPRDSTVMLLVDGSGTMFAGTGPTVWERVRDALLPTVDAVDAQQSIGFLAMSAELNACPAFQEVAPVRNNYAAIASKYSAIGKPNKGESPFPLALDRAAQLLDGKVGDKHVIFVIDGEPDYCNDGQPDCAIDSTVWRLQKLRAAGVTTHVAALPFPPILPDVSASRQSYANAGAGLPVSPFGTEYIGYYSCSALPKWAEDHAATGKAAETLIGAYSATPGAAPFSALDPLDTNGLRASFAKLLAKTRSCSFDVQGGELVVDAAKTQGSVSLNGQQLPFSDQNGWNLPSSTVVELTGGACAAYRDASAPQLVFGFPCAVWK